MAALLGVSGVSLYRGFTTKTRVMKGQLCKSFADVTAVSFLSLLLIGAIEILFNWQRTIIAGKHCQSTFILSIKVTLF